jgi:hypothetical protein
MKDGLRFGVKGVGLLFASLIGYVIFWFATTYLMAWWTGRSMADVFP